MKIWIEGQSKTFILMESETWKLLEEINLRAAWLRRENETTVEWQASQRKQVYINNSIIYMALYISASRGHLQRLHSKRGVLSVITKNKRKNMSLRTYKIQQGNFY
jgi:hypothetical protein